MNADDLTHQPPVRRRLLGSALRAYRESAGYELSQAARILDCDRSKVSRIETGQRGIGSGELRELLTEYGVPGDEQAALAVIAHHGHDDGWWQGFRDVLSSAGRDLAIMEAAATEILAFQPQHVPDLLQTEEYARALAHADPACSGDGQRARVVEAKLVRQAVVLGERSAHLEVVLAEGAVRQMVGGPEVMRRQLRRLANLGAGGGGTGEGGPGEGGSGGERTAVGDVTVQVLPFGTGAHAVAGTGAATILRFASMPGLGVVHLDGLAGGASLEGRDALARYSRAFARLRAAALSPADSGELLRDMAAALPRA
ncbi:MAG TPA: helix-turn-helix transcriptional regulator [Trebonia sp.]